MCVRVCVRVCDFLCENIRGGSWLRLGAFAIFMYAYT